MKSSTVDENKIINRASTVGIAGNVLLTVFKLAAGIAGHSTAMVSDAIHSLSDVFATLIAFVGVRLSKKDADKNHPYGHERLETVASVALSFILIATALMIGFAGIEKIMDMDKVSIEVPTMLPLIAAIVSIATKEAMFWYTRSCAIKIDSDAFMADAWHHRSDAISSVGALIGIVLARMGYPIFDPIVSILIALMILKVAYDILKGGIENLVDKSCDDDTVKNIVSIARSVSGVICVDDIKTREFGNKMYVDLEIRVDGNMTLQEAHSISDNVHDKVEKEYPKCKHCMIHVNPSGEVKKR